MTSPRSLRFLPLGLLATLAACATEPGDLAPADPMDTAPAAGFDAGSAQAAAEDVLAANPKITEGVEELRLISSEVDDRGLAHVRYQQVQDGVDVVGGEVILHLYASGTLFRLTDDLVRDVDVDTVPTHGAADAIEHALSLQPVTAVQEAAPTAELRVVRLAGQDHLAWMVSLRQVDDRAALSMPVVFVDAHALKSVWSFENLKSASLSDSDKTTYDMNRSTRYNRASVGDSSDPDLLMTHDSVGQSLAFLGTVGRDSFDGNGAVVKSYGHYSRNYVNAFWDGSRLTFGDGDGYNSDYLGVLDVTAHELGHGVTEYEANLVYSYESGALNEAWSDIMAASVEAFVDGGTSQDAWDIGEDCWLAAPALRYMSHPSDDGSSRDHYSARYTGSSDNGGVHWNSGIANHAFYLLSDGGQHHNAAYRSGYAVSGVGITVAYEIFYTALSSYMTSSTNFAGARTATENACAGLGYASTVCDEVSLAWYEVGVGSDPGTGGGGGTGGGDTGTPVDTGTTDTGTVDTGTGGGGVTCPAGWAQIDDNLVGTGDDDQFTYTTSATGAHEFQLVGPAGTDFDLYLYKANKRGRYSTVASSTSSGSTESISYSGGAASYLVQVSSYAGAGDYTLCYQIP